MVAEEEEGGGSVFRLLAAVDGSENAERASRMAASMAPPGSNVRILLVLSFHLDPFTPLGEPTPDTVEMGQALEAEIQKRTAATAELFEAAGHNVEVVHRFGHPADEVLSEIEAWQPSLVVLGRRGVSPVDRWMLGSVTTRVLHHSEAPLLVVP